MRFEVPLNGRRKEALINVAILLQYLYSFVFSPPSKFAKWYDLLRFAKARRSSPWLTQHTGG
jgi:hypothetical protein